MTKEEQSLWERHSKEYRKMEKENALMRILLRQWLQKHRGQYKPGAWEYDHAGAELCEATGAVLEIDDPWSGV